MGYTTVCNSVKRFTLGFVTKGILCCYNNVTYASGSTKLYRSTDSGATWSASLIDINPDFFVGVNINPTTNTVIAFTNNGKIYRSTNGTTFTLVDTTALGTILSPLYGAVATHNNTWVAGEYSTSSGNKRILTSTDDGATWTATLTKNDPADIRHFHSAIWLTSQNKFLMTSGDSNLQVNWYTSADGLSWTTLSGIADVSSSSQKFRNLSMVETTDYLVWAADTAVSPAVYKLALTDFAAGNYSNAVKLYDLPHACWGIAYNNGLYMAVTSVETGDVDLNATIHTSKNLDNWRIDKKWPLAATRVYGGFRSIQYLSSSNVYMFAIQYLDNTTSNGYFGITATLK